MARLVMTQQVLLNQIVTQRPGGLVIATVRIVVMTLVVDMMALFVVYNV